MQKKETHTKKARQRSTTAKQHKFGQEEKDEKKRRNSFEKS
jgi:hypothetical protein